MLTHFKENSNKIKFFNFQNARYLQSGFTGTIAKKLQVELEIVWLRFIGRAGFEVCTPIKSNVNGNEKKS